MEQQRPILGVRVNVLGKENRLLEDKDHIMQDFVGQCKKYVFHSSVMGRHGSVRI